MDTRSAIEDAGKSGYVTGAWSVGQETEMGKSFCHAFLLGMESGTESKLLADELRFLADVWFERWVKSNLRRVK